jgi:hypothetical protein
MAMSLPISQDGRIDVAALDQWPRGELRDWLLARLKGEDTLWPVDDANFETPDALFVRLWRQADPRSAFVERLERACADVLRLAWESEPALWMEPLFHLVATIRPEACRPILNSIAMQHDFSSEFREQKLDRAWLATLAAYDRQATDLIHVWLDLLHDVRYVDIAYQALSHSLDLAVFFLPQYYSALSEVERSVLLPEALRSITARGWDLARPSFQRYRKDFEETPGLCDAVNAVLAEMQLPTVFAQASASASLPTAGPSPDSVLQDIASVPAPTKAAA